MATLNTVYFSKKSGRLSSAGPEIWALSSHCSVKFQPILDCIIPYFKLKYEDSENIKNTLYRYSLFKVTGIRPMAPVQNRGRLNDL